MAIGDLKERIQLDAVFVMGNAPSMRQANWTYLKNEVTVGANYVLKAFEPTYVFMIDRKTWLQDPDLFENRPKTTIYAGEQHAIGHIPPKHFKVFERYENDENFFSPDIKQGLRYGQSSIIPALNFAALLKPKNIILIGVDLDGIDHFYTDEHRDGKFPATRKVLEQLAWAYDSCLKMKIQMLNASPSPTCKVTFLPKIDIPNLFM